MEHWLNSLHSSEPASSNIEGTLRVLIASVDKLTKQFESQQLALHHIADRLEILEHSKEQPDPWLDSTSTCLENTIIDPLESVYVVHKEDEIPVEEKVNEDKPVVEVKPVVEEAAVEAEAEAEEDGGVELEEITYKDVSYYKDTEGFVYGIDDEGQPTEQPIGVWKEKSQSVSFYRLK